MNEADRQFLDRLDHLTAIMVAASESGDHDTFADALDESIAVEKRLAASRDSTWSMWWRHPLDRVFGFGAFASSDDWIEHMTGLLSDKGDAA